MTRPLAALLAFLLVGCWVGGDFYTAADLRQPIPPGTYRLSFDAADPSTLRIWNGADGYTHSTVEGERVRPGRTGFAPLDAEGRLFAAWAVQESDREVAPTSYVLFGRMDDGNFAIVFPRCDGVGGYPAGADTEWARGVCRFSTRAALEDALRSLAPRLAQGATLTLVAAP